MTVIGFALAPVVRFQSEERILHRRVLCLQGALQQQQMLVRKHRQALEKLVKDGVRHTRLLTWLVVDDG